MREERKIDRRTFISSSARKLGLTLATLALVQSRHRAAASRSKPNKFITYYETPHIKKYYSTLL